MVSINITSDLALLTYASFIFIAFGLLYMENFIDERFSKRIGLYGLFLYILGWIGISFAAILHQNFNVVAPYWRNGLPAILVLISGVFTMAPFFTNKIPKKVSRISGYVFILSWILFAVSIGFKNSRFQADRFYPAVLGSIFIISGMYHLMMYRKLNPSSFKYRSLSKIRVYNPGLMLYSIGWFLIIFSLLIE